jgi:hypothetical protein
MCSLIAASLLHTHVHEFTMRRKCVEDPSAPSNPSRISYLELIANCERNMEKMRRSSLGNVKPNFPRCVTNYRRDSQPVMRRNARGVPQPEPNHQPAPIRLTDPNPAGCVYPTVSNVKPNFPRCVTKYRGHLESKSQDASKIAHRPATPTESATCKPLLRTTPIHKGASEPLAPLPPHQLT